MKTKIITAACVGWKKAHVANRNLKSWRGFTRRNAAVVYLLFGWRNKRQRRRTKKIRISRVVFINRLFLSSENLKTESSSRKTLMASKEGERETDFSNVFLGSVFGILRSKIINRNGWHQSDTLSGKAKSIQNEVRVK